ncbi:MAG: hypothetical protein LCI00_17620 [Chloroflexi bacterium]|nr:hypothetical protein [Chloroflexota bacterium]MCC6896734.1 hypothetical protein [Anaerolineae bacterium]
MSITTKWFNENETILLETFEGKWSLNDYIALVDEAADLLQKKDYFVHLICDFTGTKTMPTGNTLVAMRHADKKAPKNQGHTVFVNPGAFISVILNIAKNSRMKVAENVHVCKSVDEAFRLIQSLPALELA